MKRTLAALMLPILAATSTVTMADNGAGCGLGQNVFAGQSGLGPHVLAATTNGTSSNQLFGLSFDSLGCNGETVITAQFQRNIFVAANFDNIARDAAQGGGEHLRSLAVLMNMTDADVNRFFKLTQIQYDDLFGQPVENAENWIGKLDAALLSDSRLSQYSMSRV